MSIATFSRRYKWYKPPGFPSINWGHPLANQLVGNWLINEYNGPVHDLTGRRAPGTLNNVSWSQNQHGPAIAFNDTVGDENVTLAASGSPYIVGGRPDCTIIVEGQITTSTLHTGAARNIFAEGGSPNNFLALGCNQFFFGDDYLTVQYVNDAGDSMLERGNTAQMGGEPGPIRQFALTKKGTNFKLFYDGKEDGSFTYGFADTFTETSFGAYLGLGFFVGFIGSCYLYTRALSAAELQWLIVEPYAHLILEPQPRAYSLAPRAVRGGELFSPMAGF